MNKSVRYNTFTTSAVNRVNGDDTAVLSGESILNEGFLVLSSSTNVQGIRKLSAMKLSVSVPNSYSDGVLLIDMLPIGPYQVQICVIRDGEVFNRYQSGSYNITYPYPHQTLAVVSLQDLLQNGFEWSGSIEIPPGYYVVAVLWELVPGGQAPRHFIKEDIDLCCSASLRLTF